MNRKKVLVLVQNYPDNNGNKSLMYVHARNLYYVKQGIEVVVLSFSCSKSYQVDGIKVISYSDYDDAIYKNDILLCHAPNIKNHYRFLRKYGKNHKKRIFFFHGHEIVKLNEAYPEPYSYRKKKFKKVIQSLYDTLKLRIWRYYFQNIDLDAKLVFVSNSLLNDFIYYTRIDLDKVKQRISIINNGVGKVFEEQNYDVECNKEYDFLTIRSNFDEATYCIDIIRDLAICNPSYRFLIIGKGDFFNHYSIPNNLIVISKVLNHEEMIKYINKSKYALMPTRRDSQGVMSCELSTFGIPLITSNIGVCKEIFDGMRNVYLCNFEELNTLETVVDKVVSISSKKNTKYSEYNTVAHEVDLIKNYI